MMWTVNFAVAGCLCMLVLANPCCCEPLGGPDSIGRPVRPKSFSSPDDLRLYLDQLGQYFAVAGRPRFGKRTSYSKPSSREVVSNFPYFPQTSSLSDSDVYDIIQYYQSQQQD